MITEKQKTFLLGLTSGIAIVSFVGFLIMASAYVQRGKDFDKKNEEEAETDNNVIANKAPVVQDNIKIEISNEDRILGDKNAPITIVEYSDLQCPYCAKFHQTMNRIVRDFPEQVRWVYRHFPLSSHPYAKKSALASECAGDQGKFWEYANTLFENQARINNDFIREAAQNLKLDMDKFDECLEEEKYLDKVNNDFAEGKKAGVSGTPTSFINGKRINGGAIPYDQLKNLVEGVK